MGIGDDPLADIRAEVEQEMKEAGEAAEAEETKAAEAKEAKASEEAADESSEEGEKTEVSAEAEETKEEKKEEKKPARDWRMERINELTAKKKERDRQFEELQAQHAALLAKLKGEEATEADEQEVTKPRAKTEAEIRAEIEQEILQKQEAAAFNEESNRAYDIGTKTYGESEFTEATETLRMIGLNKDSLSVALATDAPAKVLFLLAQDPNEASRVFALSPLKMAAAMTKLAMTSDKVAAKKVSSAPVPIKPVNSKGGELDELTSDASDAVVSKYLDKALERIHSKHN